MLSPARLSNLWKKKKNKLKHELNELKCLHSRSFHCERVQF